MKLKLAFATATAIGLVTGAAMAGNNNQSEIHQVGGDNSAEVTQNGDNNRAGFDDFDANNWTLRQDGNNNVLVIEQNGDQNDVGLSNVYSHNGVKQRGDRNSVNILQNGIDDQYSRNIVGTIQQTGAPGATVTTNAVNIEQTGSGVTPAYGHHYIGQITQTNSNAGVSSAEINKIDVKQIGGGFQAGNVANRIVQSGVENDVDLDQAGAHNRTTLIWQDGRGHRATIRQDNSAEFGVPTYPYPIGPWGNTIGEVTQVGDENTATVDQDGNRNRIDLIWQNSTSFTPGNTATLRFEGNDNGQAGLGLLGTGYAQSAAGTWDRSAFQFGFGNTIDLYMLGGSNQFGFYQQGGENRTGNVTLSGSNNEIGVSQSGTKNEVDLGTVNGNSNDIGVRQNGDQNLATINLSDTDDSDDNAISIDQESMVGALTLKNVATVDAKGDDNLARIKQTYGSDAEVGLDGDGNDIFIEQWNQAGAVVDVLGNNNYASLLQLNGASATLSITGDDTNRSGFSGGITSTMASSTISGLGVPMQVGGIIQNGNSSTSITVGGLGASDGNLFSINQLGNGNSIVGAMDGDGGNEAVVAQVGSLNNASFSQNGGGNLVAVKQ